MHTTFFLLGTLLDKKLIHCFFFSQWKTIKMRKRDTRTGEKREKNLDGNKCQSSIVSPAVLFHDIGANTKNRVHTIQFEKR